MPDQGGPDRPDYKVYKSRPGLLSRLRAPDVASLRDRGLGILMTDHNVEGMTAENGDFWIPLAQPYGRFVSEMFEPQRYPEVKLVSGRDIVRPYDVSAWTLPLMMGVEIERRGNVTRMLGPARPRARSLRGRGARPSGPRRTRPAARAAGGTGQSVPSPRRWARRPCARADGRSRTLPASAAG